MKIEITLDQLKSLLNQQKEMVAEKLLGCTSYYNPESTAGHIKSMAIDKDKFKSMAMECKHPNDIIILDKYLPKN